MRGAFAGLRVRAARALLAGVLLAAPLFVGSVHPVIVGAEASLLSLAAALALSAPGQAGRLRLGALGWTMAAAVAWTALQLLPLPEGLLHWLSPHAYSVNLASPLLENRGAAPLTIDPAATLGALAQGIALLALFVGVRLCWPRMELRSTEGPLRYVALGSVLASLAALAHAVVRAKTVFGLYRPLAVHAGLVSLPLVNTNHLAGLMNVGALASVGLAIEEDRREARWGWWSCAALCAVTTLLTLSRGGIAALVLGGSCLVVRGGARRRGLAGTVLPLVAFVAAAGAYLAAGPLRAKLATLLDLTHLAETDRLPLLRDATRMALAYPFTGAGRGTFVLGFPPFSTQSRITTYTHPEVLPLQLASEWGIPFAAVFLAVCGATWVLATRRTRSAGPRLAALAAVLAVCAQNLVDFSLEVAAIALPVVACLAIGARTGAPTRGEPVRLRQPLGVAAWVVAGLAAFLAGSFASRHGFEADGRTLRGLADRGDDHHALAATGRQMIRSHPADTYLPIQVARGLIRIRPASALPFLNRALWLDANSPGAQLLTGRALVRLGLADQGILHYRAAARDPKLAGVIAHEVAALVRSPDTALRFVPPGEGGLGLLQTLAQGYLGRSDTASALQLGRELVHRSGRAPYAMTFLARALVAARRPEEAIAAARATRDTDQRCLGASAEADALRQLSRLGPAIELLQRAARWCPVDAALHQQLALLAIEAADWAAADRALAAYRGTAGDEDPARAYGYFLEGRIEQARQKYARAAAAFQHAVDLAPESEQYRQTAIHSWERIGREDRAASLRRAGGGSGP